MITKINDVAGTAAFDSFSWTAGDLAKLNVIYGWNGSGKTTLSRVANFLERRAIHLPDLAEVTFSIGTDSGVVKQHHLSTHALNIRVFNEDFIRDNVAFENGQARSILIVGQENIAIHKEIEALEAAYEREKEACRALSAQRPTDAKVEAILTDAGRAVTKQFGNTPLANDQYYGRNYNKARVESRVITAALTAASVTSAVLSQEELDLYRDIIKNERQTVVSDVVDYRDAAALFDSANDLLARTIHIDDLVGLKDDKELRDWMEKGYALHRERDASACLFCTYTLGLNVLSTLGGFFTDELAKAKKAIDECRVAVREYREALTVTTIESASLSPDIANAFREVRAALTNFTQTIGGSLDELEAALTAKRERLHENEWVQLPVSYPREAVACANTAAQRARCLLEEHNALVAKTSERTVDAARAIELHTISSVMIEKEFFAQQALTRSIDGQLAPRRQRLASSSEALRAKRAELQDASIAVERINGLLETFFGDAQLYLELAEPAEGDRGYRVKSRGRDARHLSEGEKSVLALVYFMIKLDEDGCDKETCTIIIDDPVDSQDSVFLFRTFGLIRGRLGDAGQLIVLTHNFEFFNLMRDWLNGIKKKENAGFFLMRLDRGVDGRVVVVEDLPALLKQYKSEYQYIFARLYHFVEGTAPLDAPLVANVGRKLLEYFSSFKWSCKTTEKFANIVSQKFIDDPDPARRGTGEFIVKFLHEYSHGQDFARPIAAAAFEARPVAEHVLRFIQLADSEHFDALTSEC